MIKKSIISIKNFITIIFISGAFTFLALVTLRSSKFIEICFLKRDPFVWRSPLSNL